MESIKTIVKGTTAKIGYVCEGKIYYVIDTAEHQYQLEINTNADEWKATYAFPEIKAISLMRWIRRGIDEPETGKFVQLK